MSDNNRIIYEEIQGFRQLWLWVLLLITLGIQVIIFGYGIIIQLVYGIPWGDNPMTDKELIISSLLIFLIGLLLFSLIYFAKLITQVRSDGLYIRFIPFHRRLLKFSFNEIDKFYARTYSPILEYGGWGIRSSLTGKKRAYNVRGKEGVQLILKNGKEIMIGSQNARELEKAMKSVMHKSILC